jgi:hypothetical protein
MDVVLLAQIVRSLYAMKSFVVLELTLGVSRLFPRIKSLANALMESP